MRKRKLLSLVMAMAMVLSLLPATVWASGSLPDANDGTITLTEAISGDITIDEDNLVLDGQNNSFTNGTLTITGAGVTVKNLTFGDMATLKVTTTGSFTLTDCKFEPTTPYSSSSGVRTAAYLKVGSATVTNNTFSGVENGYYNAIEFGIGSDPALSQATISHNTFEKMIKNNYFNFII